MSSKTVHTSTWSDHSDDEDEVLVCPSAPMLKPVQTKIDHIGNH